MKKLLVNFLKFLAFLSVGLTILYFVYRKQNEAFLEKCKNDGIAAADCDLIDKIVQDFLSVDFFWIVMILLAFMVSNISRALRWQMLIRPMGYQTRFINAFMTIIIGYLANLGLPRVGEVVRAAMMARYERIPVEKLVGTIVVGRTVDVLCLLAVFGLTFLFEFDELYNFIVTNREGDGASDGLLQQAWFQILAGIGILGAILLFVFRKQFQQTKLYQKVIKVLEGLWEGIKSVRKLENPWIFILHSINIWVMYYFMTYLCFFAFGPTEHLPAVAALTVFAFGALGIVVPSPGGMGSFQWFAMQALAIYGIPGPDAFSFSNILFFSIQLGCNLLVGILCLAFLPLVNRNYTPLPQTT